MIKTIIKPIEVEKNKGGMGDEQNKIVIENVNNRGVMKAGMKLFSQHANLLTDQILKDALDLL